MSGKIEPGFPAANSSANASQAAGSILGKVGEQARQAGAQAASLAGDIAGDARSRAASLASEVTDRVAVAAEGGKADFAEQLDDVAKAVHRSGEQLEGHQDWLAQLVEQGADELGTLAATLRTNDMQGLMGKLNDLARRQPAVFVGAAMALGFATVRIGKVAAAGATHADLPNLSEMTREPN